jgi:hypothetical protein
VPGEEGSSALPTSTSAQLIDNLLQTGLKSGCSFSFSPRSADGGGNMDTYAITAAPITPGVTRVRYFHTDEPAVIRASSTGDATSASIAIS